MTLAEIVETYRLSATFGFASSNHNIGRMPRGTRHWKVALTGPTGKTMSFRYSQAPGIKRDPTTEDVVECMIAESHLHLSEEAESIGINPVPLKLQHLDFARIMGDQLDAILAVDIDY
jgi:hypothetical protein